MERKREVGEGRKGGREMKRVIGIMMILLIVNVVMISCGSGGPG